ncbi:hypothetical protein TNCV_127381, partial [Trichonephila clavipes]
NASHSVALIHCLRPSRKWQVAWNLRSSCPGNGRTSSSELIKNRAELNESDIRVKKIETKDGQDKSCWKTVADEVRSLMKELPCKLQYDWSRPINAESGRGKTDWVDPEINDPEQGDLEIKIKSRFHTKKKKKKKRELTNFEKFK